MSAQRLRYATAGLLLVSAALFAVGVVLSLVLAAGLAE
jgi:hypothetical protein